MPELTPEEMERQLRDEQWALTGYIPSEPMTSAYRMTYPLTQLQQENARLRRENEWLRQSIERLQAQIAAMQAERWTPTIATEPGCDAEAEWQEHKE